MKWKDFFTKVYLINLSEREDRLDVSRGTLEENGIEFERWEATKMENGVLGLLDTMKKLFTHVLENTDDQNILVLEDDFKFLLPPNGFLNMLVEQLPTDYDCLFLGCNLLTVPTRFSENLLKIEQSYSTHAIGYSRAAIEKIMPLFEKPVAYDIMLRNGIQWDGKCYCTYPMLATQHAGHSSIENKFIDWGSYISQSYRTYTKGI